MFFNLFLGLLLICQHVSVRAINFKFNFPTSNGDKSYYHKKSVKNKHNNIQQKHKHWLDLQYDAIATEDILASDIKELNSKEMKVEQSLNILELCLCGAFASAFADFVMHPVDTIKVFQQTAAVPLSVLTAATNIFRNNGLLGFYPGVIPYCIADGVSGAIKFAVFEVTKTASESRFSTAWLPLSRFVCAAAAMLACSITLVPGEVIKTRLQSGGYGSISDLISSTLHVEGIGGFFTGYMATLIRDVPYTMLELGLYENIKAFLRKFRGRSDLSSSDELLAAALTGGITSFVTTPLDLVKTKLMVQTAASGTAYLGVWDALSSIYETGGISGLFVGSVARVAWLLPFTTIYLGVYELTKRNVMRLRKSNR